MSAVLLTVNLDGSSWRSTFAADVGEIHRTGVLRRSWHVAATPAIDDGADVWLLTFRSDGSGAGIIGHGILASSMRDQPLRGDRPLPGPAGYGEGWVLFIEVDQLLARGDEVPAQAAFTAEGLVATPLDEGTDGRVDALSPAEALALRRLWAAHSGAAPASSAPLPGTLPASALRRGADNRFEVDPDLRRMALAHNGSVCHACGLDGEQAYGPAGVELMQVHLITPPSLIDERFLPDALTDLVPVCPTCHVVLHSVGPDSLTVAQVRSMLRTHGFLRGEVMSEYQLEAEELAGRILEAGQ